MRPAGAQSRKRHGGFQREQTFSALNRNDWIWVDIRPLVAARAAIRIEVSRMAAAICTIGPQRIRRDILNTAEPKLEPARAHDVQLLYHPTPFECAYPKPGTIGQTGTFSVGFRNPSAHCLTARIELS